jgi:hypothetical protein
MHCFIISCLLIGATGTAPSLLRVSVPPGDGDCVPAGVCYAKAATPTHIAPANMIPIRYLFIVISCD